MLMEVLVTGGAGYIGSALVSKLLEEGYGVASVDNLCRGDYRYLKDYGENPDLELVVADICDGDRLEEVMATRDFGAVVHLAAIPGLERCRRDPEAAVSTNVYGTYNVVEMARRHDVDGIVFTSSAAVYGVPSHTPISEDEMLKPTNLYGVTKLAGEKLVEACHDDYGLDAVVLRFGNVYGVGVYTYWETVIPKFVRQAWMDQPLTVYGDGGQSRDFIHVWDVVQAVMLALKAEEEVAAGQVFNVATGKPTTVNSIAQKVSEVFHVQHRKKVETKHLPPREGEPYTPDFCLSPDKIQNQLHFKPRWKIEQGIKQLVKYGSTLSA